MMQALIELPRTAQVAFLLQVVEQLGKYQRKFAHATRLARSVEVSEPALVFDGKTLEWRFEYSDSQGDDEDFGENGLLTVTMSFDELWLKKAAAGTDLLANCFDGPWERSCSCGVSERTSTPCLHFLAAVEGLANELSQSSVVKAIAWMNTRLRDLSVLGDELVSELESSVQGIAEKKASTTRLQWRISEIDFSYYHQCDLQVVACVQKLSSKNRWTAGREVRAMDVVRDSVVDLEPQDELICSLVELQHEQGEKCGSVFYQLLNLLKERPLVHWNRPSFPPVEFVETQPTVRIVDSEGDYKVEINVEGNEIKESDFFLRINRHDHLGVLTEPNSNRLLYFKVPTSLLGSVFRLQQGQKSGAKFSQEAALRVSTVLKSGGVRGALRTELPTSLAGPEVPLPAKLQLHLLPRQPEGLIAQLRVACDAVEELPIPGIAPDRLQVVTPAGAGSVHARSQGRNATRGDLHEQAGLSGIRLRWSLHLDCRKYSGSFSVD